MRAWAIKYKSSYLSWDADYDILAAARLYLNKENAERLLYNDEQVVEVEIKEVENE